MPTGYTAAVADGITFEQFVLRCSRAMGALILMRDEPMDAPIPDRFEPSDYHQKKIEEATALIAKLDGMDGEEVETLASEDFDAEMKRYTDRIAKDRDLRGKYEAMLGQVQAWTPPTKDHEGFKTFMVKQLQESIEFDCNERYYDERRPQKKTGEQWLDEQIANARRDIEYHTKNHAEEVERTEGRNAWLEALRGSL